MQTVKNVFHCQIELPKGLCFPFLRCLGSAYPFRSQCVIASRQRPEGCATKKSKRTFRYCHRQHRFENLREGEWKVRTHGKSKRRTWRKLHIGVDPKNGEIQTLALTSNSVSDDQMVKLYSNRYNNLLIDLLAMAVTINVRCMIVSTNMLPVQKF